MVKYLTQRGYTPDLAQTLAANVEAHPEVKSNQDLVTGAQRWVATQQTGQSDVSPALAMTNLKDQYAKENVQGQKADSLASYFQRLGMPADQAITLAHHATGTPDSVGKAPLEHAQTQIAEHPVISPDLYKSLIGGPQVVASAPEGN